MCQHHHKASPFVLGETPLGEGALLPTKEEQLYERGLLRGFYTIDVSGDSCDYCAEHTDQVYSFEEDDPLPPFHNNCQCEVSVQLVDASIDWSQLRDVFDIDSGTIGELATPELVTRAVNDILRRHGLDQELTWEEILEFGIYTPGEALYPTSRDAETDIEDLIGSETSIDTSTVFNADNDMAWWLQQAKIDGELISGWSLTDKLGGIWGLSVTGAKYDPKNNPLTPFGAEVDGQRQYWGFIYNGQLYHYDDAGNILFGALAAASGLAKEVALAGAMAFNLISEGERDAARDQELIEYGYNLLYTKPNLTLDELLP